MKPCSNCNGSGEIYIGGKWKDCSYCKNGNKKSHESTPPSEQVTDSHVGDIQVEGKREGINIGDRVIDPNIAPRQGLIYLGGDTFLNDMGDEVVLPDWKNRFQFVKAPAAKQEEEDDEWEQSDASIIAEIEDYESSLAAKDKEIANLMGSISVMVEQADDFRDQISKRDKEIAELKEELAIKERTASSYYDGYRKKMKENESNQRQFTTQSQRVKELEEERKLGIEANMELFVERQNLRDQLSKIKGVDAEQLWATGAIFSPGTGYWFMDKQQFLTAINKLINQK